MSIYGYRRGSIFWALTLIAVGAIFLWESFNPSIHPWQVIAKFWPILIIFWGLSKLVVYIQAQAHPETVPPPLFTASEVVLLVLVLVLGTVISKVILRPWQQWPASMGVDMDNEGFEGLFMNSHTYTQTFSHLAHPQPHILVVDRHGDVEVHAADQATVDGVVKKTIWAPNEDDARKLSDQVKIEIVEEAGRYLVQTNLDSLPGGGHNVRLDYTLRVPYATSTEVTVEHGDAILDGLKAEQAVTARHGDAHITNVEGLVRLTRGSGMTEVRDLKGSVEVEGRGSDVDISGVTGTASINGEFSGDMHFRDISQTLQFKSSRTDMTAQKLTGRLDMEMGSLEVNGIDGPFEVSTRQKDITLTDFRHSVKITDTNGDVELRSSTPPTHPIEVDLKKGEIELSLPAASSFQIDAASPHGEVESDFNGPGLKVAKEGDNPTISGSVGKGGPPIRLDTHYGTIRLLRMGPHPPTPPTPPHLPAGDEKQAWNTHLHQRSFSGAAARAVSFVPLSRLVGRFRQGERTRIEDLLDAYTPADLRWRCPPPAKSPF
jgi:DUF4097 and DUF4098 domain-containing protein YvlB